jgi:Ca2+-binding RTX toxin-like protein
MGRTSTTISDNLLDDPALNGERQLSTGSLTSWLTDAVSPSPIPTGMNGGPSIDGAPHTATDGTNSMRSLSLHEPPTDSAVGFQWQFTGNSVGPRSILNGIASVDAGGAQQSDIASVGTIDIRQRDALPLYQEPDGEHDHDDGGAGMTTVLAADDGTVPQPLESSTPVTGTAVSTYSLEGSNGIDSLTSGSYKWGSGALGTGVTLTYSFGTVQSAYISGYSEPTHGFAEFSDHQKDATRAALQYWSDVADITFVEATDSATVAGDLRFARSSDPSTAWAYLPSSHTKGGDVWVGLSGNYNNMSDGTYGFQTLLHEIGHALGLKHPHDGSIVASSSIDWLGYTVMSYRSFEGAATGYRQDLYPTTPMYNDIRAIQYLYGTNDEYNSGNTTYSWNAGAELYRTIWDAGGTDTIDWSNQSTAATIDLNAGSWSQLGPSYIVDYTVWPYVTESRTLMIADGVVIENATGGSATDTIIGNAADNVINGGTGNDILSGNDGADTFLFDLASGNDTINDFQHAQGDKIDLTAYGFANFASLLAATNDTNFNDVGWDGSLLGNSTVVTLSGGNSLTLRDVVKAELVVDDFVGIGDDGTYGSDVLVGTGNADTISGFSGADNITGGDGGDTLNGDDGNDILYGGLGNDTLNGGAHRDMLYGQGGNDTLNGGSGHDTLDGGPGSDTMAGGTGNDLFIVDNIADSVVEDADAGADTVQSSVTFTLGANIEDIKLTGSSAIDGTGNSSANFIQGNSAANTLSGGGGDDSVFAFGGDDTVYGGAGNDSLYGDAGSDTIDGGAGDDTLRGGGGRDTFVFTSGFGSDVLADFSSGIDQIDLSALSPGTFSELLALTADDGGDAVIALVDGTIRITGVAKADLLEGDFIGLSAMATSGDDTLAGTDGSDTIDGLGGNDTISAGAGNDFLIGGAGNDTLDGGAGDDTLTGGTGNDTYVVDSVGDSVTENSGEGTDTVRSSVTWTLGANIENLALIGLSAIDGTGNTAANIITGNAGANTLVGGGGLDKIYGGGGDDVLTGGDDTNELHGEDGDDTLTGGASWDVLIGGAGADTVSGLGGNDWIRGEDGNDTLYGGAGRDKLFGEAGNDTLDGGTNNDYMAGGLGDDTYVVDHVADQAVENADEGTDTVRSSITWTIGSNIENLVLTGSSDIDGNGNALDNTIIGNSGDNLLYGGAGNDTLSGGAGNDTLSGGSGNDTMEGGLGDDIYIVDSASDAVTENAGEGTDTVSTSVSWTLGADVEILTLTGAGAIDGTGNELDNNLIGNESANVLTGAAGNDRLEGQGGADTLVGGLGDDTYVIDDLLDSISENADEGTDAVESSVSWTLGSNVENLTLTAAGNIDGTGNNLSNTILGNSGNNILTGGGGADVLRGDDGDDTLYGGDSGDTLIGGAGTDTLYGDAGNDWMRGEDGNDTLYGGAGADKMFGENGNDVLHGGDGGDRLTGGAGIDHFAYAAITEAGDVIVDFTAGSGGDAVDVSALLASFGYAGADAFADGYLRSVQSGADTAVQVDANGGGDGYVILATLQDVTQTDLTNDNWLV